MHRTEPTAQQNLALQLAEKLGSLVENNERVFDHKQGTYGGYFRGEWWFCRSIFPMILVPLSVSRSSLPVFPVHLLPADQKDGYRKNEGYMRRGGYRQQQSQTAY